MSYRQILQDIITLVKPDGPLHRLLLADVLTHQQLTALAAAGRRRIALSPTGQPDGE